MIFDFLLIQGQGRAAPNQAGECRPRTGQATDRLDRLPALDVSVNDLERLQSERLKRFKKSIFVNLMIGQVMGQMVPNFGRVNGSSVYFANNKLKFFIEDHKIRQGSGRGGGHPNVNQKIDRVQRKNNPANVNCNAPKGHNNGQGWIYLLISCRQQSDVRNDCFGVVSSIRMV
jgi:hypothetical protein